MPPNTNGIPLLGQTGPQQVSVPPTMAYGIVVEQAAPGVMHVEPIKVDQFGFVLLTERAVEAIAQRVVQLLRSPVIEPEHVGYSEEPSL